MRSKFKPTWKRKNPQIYVDVCVDSDRFDGIPDRYYITVWANLATEVFCYGLFVEELMAKDKQAAYEREQTYYYKIGEKSNVV